MHPKAEELSPEEYRKWSIEEKRKYEMFHGHREFLHGGKKHTCLMCMDPEEEEIKKPARVKVTKKRSATPKKIQSSATNQGILFK